MTPRTLPEDIASSTPFHIGLWLRAEGIAQAANLNQESDVRRIYEADLNATRRRIADRIIEDCIARRAR